MENFQIFCTDCLQQQHVPNAAACESALSERSLRKYLIAWEEEKFPTFSVTRFGEIPPLWQIFKNLWQYIYGLFGFGKVSNLLWHNLCAIGQIFITENGQILKTQFGHLVTLVPTYITHFTCESLFAKRKKQILFFFSRQR